MSHEDLMTITAFSKALEKLEQPLPEALQTDLETILAVLPASAYELHRSGRTLCTAPASLPVQLAGVSQ